MYVLQRKVSNIKYKDTIILYWFVWRWILLKPACKISKMIDKTVYLLLFLYCLQRAFFVLLRIFIFLPFDNFFFYDTFGNRWIVLRVIWSERKYCISGKFKCTGNSFIIFIVFNSFHHPHFVALWLTLPTFYWKRKVFYSFLVFLIRDDFKFANII